MEKRCKVLCRIPRQAVAPCRVVRSMQSAICLLPETLFPEKDSKLPPRLEALLAWSRLFRCGRTWRNYMGYVRTACLVAKMPVGVSVPTARVVIRQARCLCGRCSTIPP
jgi:hypothetical protein